MCGDLQTWMYIAVPFVLHVGERTLRAFRSKAYAVKILKVRNVASLPRTFLSLFNNFRSNKFLHYLRMYLSNWLSQKIWKNTKNDMQLGEIVLMFLLNLMPSGVPSTRKCVDRYNVKALWIQIQKWTICFSSVSNNFSFWMVCRLLIMLPLLLDYTFLSSE